MDICLKKTRGVNFSYVHGWRLLPSGKHCTGRVVELAGCKKSPFIRLPDVFVGTQYFNVTEGFLVESNSPYFIECEVLFLISQDHVISL